MGKNRTRNAMKNAIFGMMNQILSLLLNFVSRTIFIKILGAEYLGINALFSDVLMMLSMADLGFGTAMTYSFYKPLAENNEKKIAALVRFYKKIYNCIALAVAVIGLVLVPFLDYLVNLEQGVPYMRIYYLFFLGNTVISYLFSYKTSIINADQKNYLISKYQMYVNLARIILQSIFLVITQNYFAYLIIQILATLGNNIVASWKSEQLYPYIKKSEEKLSKSEEKDIFENMKSIFLYKVSGVLLNGTDNTLMSIIVGTVWVGVYSNYNMVINSLNNFINILYNATTAGIGNLIETETAQRRMEVFKGMQMVSLILTSFTSICLATLLGNLVYVWLGKEYILDIWTIGAIVLNFYLTGILHPIWSFREATGLYRKTKYIMVIAAIVNLTMSILLGKIGGMAGILYASAIARLSTYFWYEPKLLFKEYFEERVRLYYIPLVINFIFTTIMIIGICYGTQWIVINSWFKMILKSIIVGIISLVVVLLFYRKTEGYKILTNKAKNIIKSR